MGVKSKRLGSRDRTLYVLFGVKMNRTVPRSAEFAIAAAVIVDDGSAFTGQFGRARNVAGSPQRCQKRLLPMSQHSEILVGGFVVADLFESSLPKDSVARRQNADW